MPSPTRLLLLPGTLAAGLLLAAVLALRPSELGAPPEVVPEATVAPTARTARGRTRPTVGPTPSVVREAPAAGELVREFLAEQFGQAGSATSWHGNIEHVVVRSGTAVVETDLSDDPVDHRKAAAIGRAVLHFRETEWGRQMSGLAVEVYGQQGRLLAQEPGPMGPLGRAP